MRFGPVSKNCDRLLTGDVVRRSSRRCLALPTRRAPVALAGGARWLVRLRRLGPLVGASYDDQVPRTHDPRAAPAALQHEGYPLSPPIASALSTPYYAR